MARLNYLKQVQLCESVRKTVQHIIAQSDDPAIQKKANNLPTAERLLRAASISANLDSEEKLRDFLRECIINDLRLTHMQIEYLRQHFLGSV